jgi:hypothetical protein
VHEEEPVVEGSMATSITWYWHAVNFTTREAEECTIKEGQPWKRWGQEVQLSIVAP